MYTHRDTSVLPTGIRPLPAARQAFLLLRLLVDALAADRLATAYGRHARWVRAS
jgi:hypothetical protein